MSFKKTDIQKDFEKVISSSNANIQVFGGNPIEIIQKIVNEEKKNKRNGIIEFKDSEDFKKMNEKIIHQEVIINKLLVLLKNFINIDDLDIYNIEKMDVFIKNNSKLKDNVSYPIDIKSTSEYIELKDKNNILKKQIEELNIKINNLSNNEKITNKNIESSIEDRVRAAVDEALQNQSKEFDNKFNLYKREQELKYNSLNIDFINLKNEKTNIPTPSNSGNIKNRNMFTNEKIKLPENLLEIVYYRYIKNDYYYYINDGKNYLRCCNTNYDNKEISHTNFITCFKCFKTYNLSKDVDKNNLHKIFVKILDEHIIQNEKEILKKIKCNNCNNIYKKEIDLCNSCKYIEGCKPIVTELPDENVGRKTVECFASETFIQLNFYDKVYNTAKEEKINVYEMKPLVNYIKKNNLMKEKQPGIIIKKILRSRYILDIYNEEKYINIQDIIKRIYINLDYIPKLDDTQFDIFKNILIDILNKELEKIENINEDSNNNKNININYNQDYDKKEKCIKCLNVLLDNEFTYCNNCIKLCRVKDCKNKKQKFGNDEFDFCKKHKESSLDIQI